MEQPNKPLERDCIIFLPGIGDEQMVDQSIEGLALRIAHAMDINAGDNTAEFFQKVKAVEDLGEHRGEVGTIYRKDRSGDRAVLDIYKLDYQTALVERYENRNLLVKAILLMIALPGSLFRILRAMLFGATSKTRAEKIQLLYALVILSLLIIYVVILVGAILAIIQDSSNIANQINSVSNDISQVWNRVTGQSDGNSSKWFAQVQTTKSFILWLTQTAIVLGAVISLFLPAKLNLKDLISKAAVNYLCLIYYLNLGERRNLIIGKLENLIDEILRKSAKEQRKNEGNHYRHIYLLTYSFGSIVALDALFPQRKKPARVFESVHTLITIGCPFDFVRAFWGDYFDDRRQYTANCPVRWLNVYSPVDALGSNFRNDPETIEANVNIRSEDSSSTSDVPLPTNVKFEEGLSFSGLSWTNSLTLIGLRSHSMYWGKKPESEVNCFSDLVPKLYEGQAVLD